MYLIINEQRHTCSKIRRSKGTVEFFNVTPAPDEIGGAIKLFSNDGFLMREDNADDYSRRFMTGAILTLTNEPEAEPVEAEPTADEILDELLGVTEDE